MADLNLISAGFSAIFSRDQGTNSIHDLIGKTYIMGHAPTSSSLTQAGGAGPASSQFRFNINVDELDPKYDYDLSHVKDDGQKYMRGGYVYQPPYGWNRIAIKVVGKYEDGDVWLGGPDCIRTEQAPGEWPVSYHGTDISHANAIVEEGFKTGPRALFGEGIYTSPSLEMVEEFYAQQFTHKGKTYKIAFQNRVNPHHGHRRVISKSKTGVGADYWLSTNPGDVRPYGVLIREVKRIKRE